MNILIEALRKEQNGVCPISGEILSDSAMVQPLLPTANKTNNYDIANYLLLSKQVIVYLAERLDELAIKLSLRNHGLRDTGTVKRFGYCFVSEYEARNLRLESIAKEVDKQFSQKYVLFDYKATIMTDRNEVLRILDNLYGMEIEIDYDVLNIHEEPITLSPASKQVFIDEARRLWQNTPHYVKSTTEEIHPWETDASNQLNAGGDRVVKLNDIKIINKSQLNPALGVDAKSEVLADICSELTKDSGMMVGIFGSWGRGKTYLAEKTINKICDKNTSWLHLKFSAWKYQNTTSCWSYLHQEILNTLEQGKGGFFSPIRNIYKRFQANRLKRSTWELIYPVIAILALLVIYKIGKFSIGLNLISAFGAGIILIAIKTYFFFNASSGFIKQLANSHFSKPDFSSNLGLQAEIELSLECMLKSWLPDNSEEKLILFVDDVDRCSPEKVLDVVDGLRVILDNPEIHKRLIIITAVDERILRNAIKLKYSNFEASEQDILYKEYIQKVFLIGLTLSKLTDREAVELLNNVVPEIKTNLKEIEADTDSVDEISNVVSSTSEIRNNKPSRAEVSDSISIIENSHIESGYKERSTQETNIEISEKEKLQLAQSITKLNNRTPRSIRIFYYKYLISKKLLFMFLESKGLLEDWRSNAHENQLIEHLIAASNEENLAPDFVNSDEDIERILSKVSKFVSAI
ncbi:hypothetical protein LB044_002216 [Vibrio fluvialis]|nr:hypothetical protein [Vibrio fluvialis]